MNKPLSVTYITNLIIGISVTKGNTLYGIMTTRNGIIDNSLVDYKLGRFVTLGYTKWCNGELGNNYVSLIVTTIT